MQISTSQFYDQSSSLMQQLTARADTLNTQISTGKKLQAPSDDAVAYRQLATIKRATADDTAYGANIGIAQSLLQQSDTTLSAVESQLQRAAELAVQANSAILSTSDKTAISTELRGIRDTLVGLANTKDARGQPLFAAASGDSGVTQAANGSVTFTGSGDPPSIPIGANSEVQPTVAASRVFGGITTSSGATDTFAMLSNLADAIDAGTSTANASTDVQAALTQVTSVHGSVGARAARVDIEATSAKNAGDAREVDRSALEDTDVTAAITDLQKTMTILQATQASFTKLSSLSLFDYLK